MTLKCQSCGTAVIATPDGRCPVCREPVEGDFPSTDDPDISELIQVNAVSDSVVVSQHAFPQVHSRVLSNSENSNSLVALTESTGVDRPAYKLYSLRAIGWVAFLAGPPGALVLLAINYSRLGKRSAAWLTIGAGLLALMAITVIASFLPDSLPALTIHLPIFFLTVFTANALQGTWYASHRARGGKAASGWTAASFGVLGFVLYFGAVVGAALLYDQYHLGKRIEFGSGEVYYARGATVDDARAIGSFLRDSGYFEGGPTTVRVSRDDGGIVISFVVQSWALNDLEVEQGFRMLGEQASKQAIDGQSVRVELCDESLNVKKTLK